MRGCPAFRAVALAAGALGCACPCTALAQTQTQTALTGAPAVVPTPAELAPRAVPGTDTRQLPDVVAPPRRLAEPESLVMDVQAYTVSEQAPAELRAALARLTAAYAGAGRRYEDMVNAADDVTRFLNRELGYYLGYAYIPEQVPVDGRVRIEIIEGRLDQVILRWPETPLPVSREVIEGYLSHLAPGEVLKVRDVERVVFMVNDLRGVVARFDVQPGRLPGTASLVVTPREDPSSPGKVDLDANGSRFLGIERLGGLWSWNSPAGRGDAFTVNALASFSGGLGFVLAGYTLPVGRHGLKLGGSLSLIHYQLNRQDFPLDVSGDAVNASVYALYPWVRSRNLNTFLIAALNHTSFTDRRAAAGLVDHKQVDSLSLGATGDFRDGVLGGGVNSYELTLAGGQVRYPAGRPAGLDDAPSYSKLLLAANRLQNLVTSRLLLYASVRGQAGMANLDTSEQFRLGGPDGVRAFAPGEGTGDSGIVGTLELRAVPPEAWVGRFARESMVALFYDHGQVRYRHDASLRPAGFVNRASLGGYGVALSWARGNDYALRVSLAKPASGTPKSDTVVRSPRLYAQFTKYF